MAKSILKWAFPREAFLLRLKFQSSISRNPSRFLHLSRSTWTDRSPDHEGPMEELTEGELYLQKKLKDYFSPEHLHVKDISGGCGSMYQVEICSDKFKGLNTLKQHQLVNKYLSDDIKKMHGIRLLTSIPEKNSN